MWYRLSFELVCFFDRLVYVHFAWFCCLGSGIWEFMQICVGFDLTPIDPHADSRLILFFNTFQLSSSVLQEDFGNFLDVLVMGFCFIFEVFESIQLGMDVGFWCYVLFTSF